MTERVSMWLAAFGWTLLIETAVYVALLAGSLRSWVRPLALSLLANAVTHPALWFAFPYWEPYESYVVVTELCVTAVEATFIVLLLRRWGFAGRRALRLGVLAAVLANAASTAAGLLQLL